MYTKVKKCAFKWLLRCIIVKSTIILRKFFYNHKRKLLNLSLCLCINFDTNNKRLHFLLRKRITNMAFTKRANSLVDKLTKHLFSSSHTKSISKVKFSCNLLFLCKQSAFNSRNDKKAICVHDNCAQVLFP